MKPEMITMAVPAKKEYILPVRLFLSGLATRAGFSIDQIENTKLAIAEASSFLLTMVHSERLEFAIMAAENAITVSAVPVEPVKREMDEDEELALTLSRFMLEGLAQDIEICQDETGMLFKVEFSMENK